MCAPIAKLRRRKGRTDERLRDPRAPPRRRGARDDDESEAPELRLLGGDRGAGRGAKGGPRIRRARFGAGLGRAGALVRARLVDRPERDAAGQAGERQSDLLVPGAVRDRLARRRDDRSRVRRLLGRRSRTRLGVRPARGRGAGALRTTRGDDRRGNRDRRDQPRHAPDRPHRDRGTRARRRADDGPAHLRTGRRKPRGSDRTRRRSR